MLQPFYSRLSKDHTSRVGYAFIAFWVGMHDCNPARIMIIHDLLAALLIIMVVVVK